MNLPPIAILAGGLATRMRPVTETIPKSLIPVRGEPFLAHQFRLVYRQGFRKVVLCVGHLGELIERFVEQYGSCGLEVDFSFDGSLARGTGGAIQNALPKLGPTFFVLYGDSYLDVAVSPIYEAFRNGHASAMMTVLNNCDQFDISNVNFDGRYVTDYSKNPSHGPLSWIDFGLTIMTDGVFEEWTKDESFDLSLVIARLAARKELLGFEVRQRFYEIGSPRGLVELENYLSEKSYS